MPHPVTILDPAIGTALIARGHALSDSRRADLWTPAPVLDEPEILTALHAEHARAGADILTAWTFRTTPETLGDRWRPALHAAVDAARTADQSVAQSAPQSNQRPDRRIAGSLSPVADCYRPDLSPAARGGAHPAESRHRAVAAELLLAGVDLIVCETFAHPDEALLALRAARAEAADRVPVWLSLTPGYRGDLLGPARLAETARRAGHAGADALLVNCLPADRALDWLRPLRRATDRPVGVYANAFDPERPNRSLEPHRYADLAETWADAGATLIGACCGSDTPHLAALVARLRPNKPPSR